MPDVSAKASFCPTNKQKKEFVNQPKVVTLDVVISVACADDETTHAPSYAHTPKKKKETTHHLTELDGRLAHFIPNPGGNLRRKNSQTKAKEKVCMSATHLVRSRSKKMTRNHALATLKESPAEHKVHGVRACERVCVLWGEGG